MPPTEDLFVHLYVLAGDALIDKAVAIPPRAGPGLLPRRGPHHRAGAPPARPPAGLLPGRGFAGRALAARHSASGTAVVLAHSRAQRHQLSKAQRRPVAALRNRIETSYGETTGRLELARHGAHAFWGCSPGSPPPWPPTPCYDPNSYDQPT